MITDSPLQYVPGDLVNMVEGSILEMLNDDVWTEGQKFKDSTPLEGGSTEKIALTVHGWPLGSIRLGLGSTVETTLPLHQTCFQTKPVKSKMGR